MDFVLLGSLLLFVAAVAAHYFSLGKAPNQSEKDSKHCVGWECVTRLESWDLSLSWCHKHSFDSFWWRTLFLRLLFLAIMIIGMKTCVTINFDLFQCFTKQFFFFSYLFSFGSSLSYFWPRIFSFSVIIKNIWVPKATPLEIPAHISHYCWGRFFFLLSYDTLNFRAWNHNLGHKFPPDYLEHFLRTRLFPRR